MLVLALAGSAHAGIDGARGTNADARLRAEPLALVYPAQPAVVGAQNEGHLFARCVGLDAVEKPFVVGDQAAQRPRGIHGCSLVQVAIHAADPVGRRRHELRETLGPYWTARIDAPAAFLMHLSGEGGHGRVEAPDTLCFALEGALVALGIAWDGLCVRDRAQREDRIQHQHAQQSQERPNSPLHDLVPRRSVLGQPHRLATGVAAPTRPLSSWCIPPVARHYAPRPTQSSAAATMMARRIIARP